ncbi:ABC transporter substrate-binding protein [Paenibacillus sp. IB182496]|uniref:ABC transporter substrate-binding protein n=1 Tax=Paenibacillus sabuli TaxID=2772509 RepID=A0A927GQU6_9BACL|nr:ABC transporter substrate-binding protein [Paenibacillus sabuli]MBD2844636.1 ABC transporter substrate-binding protein [Paenibacillus sabuli]
MRNFLIVLLTSLALALVLSACGSGDTPPESGGGAAQENHIEQIAPSADNDDLHQAEHSDDAAGEPEMREFEHGKGVSRIPVHPERIVAIQYTGAMLALGVKPVGADNEWAQYPLLRDEWTDIPHVGDPWTGLNLEKIVALEPDLIVTHVEDTYEELSKIAPTLWIPWLTYDPPQQIELFGEILGRQEEAAAWLERFEHKVMQTKAEVETIIDPEETVAIVNIRPQNLFVYGNKAMGGYVIYELLGLKAPPLIRREVLDKGLGQLEISLELLPTYADANRLFVSVLEQEGGAERAEEIRAGGVWQALPAARDKRISSLDWNTFFTTDPISTMKQLDAFVELLRARQPD